MAPDARVDEPALRAVGEPPNDGRVVGWSDLVDGHREELVVGVPVAGGRRLVHGEETEGLRVVDPHRARVKLEEEPVALLRAAQRLLGGDALADVADGAREHGRSSDRNSRDRKLDREHRAVRAHRLELDAAAEDCAVAGRDETGQSLAMRLA